MTKANEELGLYDSWRQVYICPGFQSVLSRCKQMK